MITNSVPQTNRKLNCDYCGAPGARVRPGEDEALCSGCFRLDVERFVSNLVTLSARQVSQIRRSVDQAETPPTTLSMALARVSSRPEINEIAARYQLEAACQVVRFL